MPKSQTKPCSLFLPSVLVAMCLVAASQSAIAEARPHKRPNVVLIVADDLAFSDIGAFGGEISTPNLDALTARGMQLTNFYASPTCSPTRAMLLTGADHHRVGLGTMAERMAPQQSGRPGYEGFLTRRIPTIAERLKAAGYRTLMTGKWHLGLTAETSPAARGFDRSFALLQGAHNHFGFDQDRAHVASGAQALYREDRRLVAAPVGAYSSDHFTDRMIGFLDEVKGDGRPVFAYLAFTAPHWPLQAKDRDIAKYRGRYAGGPEALRNRRLAKMRKLGIIPRSVHPYPYQGSRWESLSAAERAIEQAKMEVYAAMVDNLDQNIGRLVNAVRRSRQIGNTLFIFMSDNGPDGGAFNQPVNANDPGKPVPIAFDNSAANIGRPNSHVSYGHTWAQAGAVPFRGIKGSVAEGGIHVPAIVAGVGVVSGFRSPALTHVLDVVPTILEAAQVTADDRTVDAKGLKLEGLSWARLLDGRASTVRDRCGELNWELFYQRAARRGQYKLSFLAEVHPRWGGRGKPLEQTRWELFDLNIDPGETTDIASAQPDIAEELAEQWHRYAVAAGAVGPEVEQMPRRGSAFRAKPASPCQLPASLVTKPSSQSVAVRRDAQ